MEDLSLHYDGCPVRIGGECNCQTVAIERDTVILYDRAGVATAVIVRFAGFGEEGDSHPGFFIDGEWLDWFKATHPDLSIVGSMVDTFEDTEAEVLWFMAVKAEGSAK